MSLMYYMDVHIPAAIVAGLRRRQIDVLTSQDDGTREKDDDELLQRATDLDRLLFTQDQDLLQIASDWQLGNRSFFGLVYTHQQGPSIGRCIADLELIAHCLTAEEVANRVIYIPL